jgi:xanthine dehydrogenase accessory factor
MRQADIYRRMADLSEAATPFVTATIIRAAGSSPRKTGTKMIVLADASTVDTIGGGTLERQVIGDAIDCLRSGASAIKEYELRPTGERALGMECGGEVTVFLEVHAPDKTLLIVGAGHIAQKLSPLAKLLDFRVIVADSRSELLTRERFPEADLLLHTDPEELAERLPLAASTYVVIATHTHVHDRNALRAVVGSPASYVGMIGSRRKVKTVLSDLTSEGIEASQLQRVHSPIGLDLGGQTPAEISISIIAEIIADIHGKLAQVECRPLASELTPEPTSEPAAPGSQPADRPEGDRRVSPSPRARER